MTEADEENTGIFGLVNLGDFCGMYIETWSSTRGLETLSGATRNATASE